MIVVLSDGLIFLTIDKQLINNKHNENMIISLLLINNIITFITNSIFTIQIIPEK